MNWQSNQKLKGGLSDYLTSLFFELVLIRRSEYKVTKINCYKLYKHKKQWVIGCSSMILPLLVGMTSVHADQKAPDDADNQPQPTLVQPPVSHLSSTNDNNSATMSATETGTSPASPNRSATSQPATTNDLPSSSHHPDDWSHNYERIIKINYYDHYTTDGGVSGSSQEKTVIQLAENGHWDEFNWYPPEGTFPPGVTVPPVHLSADSPTESANQYWTFSYFMRSVDFQTASGHHIASQAYVVSKGQTIKIPEMEIPQNGIPVAYRPKLSFSEAALDQVIERNGHYYLTNATLSFDDDGVVYHGANRDMPNDSVGFGESIVFSAPVNYVFKDLDGNTYTIHGDAAVYQNVAQVNFGQTLYPNTIYLDGLKYLKQYINHVLGAPDNSFKVYGYFGPDNKFHQINNITDSPDFQDAKSDTNGLTYQFAIVHQQYEKVTEPVTKTRKIVVTKPNGEQATTTQTVTLAQFANTDEITGQQLGTADWKVLTGDQPDNNDDWSVLTDGNHSWQEFTTPSLLGYTPTQAKVAAKTVNYKTKDQVVEISYQADPQITHVIYKDGNQMVKTTDLAGKTGQTVGVTLAVPDHYTVINHPAKQYTFKATDNQDIIVQLGHQTQSTSQSKDVTRTIIVTAPDGHQTTTTQTVTLTQDGVLDLVTNKTKWDHWTTGHWDAFTTPAIAGYTPTKAQVAAQTVNDRTKDQAIKISYQANPQSIHIIYKDGHQVVKTTDLRGVTGQTVNVALAVPDHYTMVNQPATQYTFKATGNQDIIIQLGHQTQPASQSKDVTRTIIVTTPDGHQTTTTQTVILTQDGILDLVTNKTKWDSWTTGHWDAFTTPVIVGYTPTKTHVAAQTVNDKTKDQVVEISYQADDQTVNIIYVTPDGHVVKTTNIHGQTDTNQDIVLAIPAGYQLVAGQSIPQTVTIKPGMADITILVEKVTPHEDLPGHNEEPAGNRSNSANQQTITDNSSVIINHKVQQEHRLPQTGNDGSTAASAAGLMLMSALFMLGLGERKRS